MKPELTLYVVVVGRQRVGVTNVLHVRQTASIIPS